MKKTTKPEEALRCSFCNKSQDAVAKLISSPCDYPRAYICDECVVVCNSILIDSKIGHKSNNVLTVRFGADGFGWACSPPVITHELLGVIEQIDTQLRQDISECRAAWNREQAQLASAPSSASSGTTIRVSAPARKKKARP
jgi:hypothetical protein